MEDDFSVSDISSHSHCQCCRDEQISEPVKQIETQFIPLPNMPQQKYSSAKPEEKIESTNNVIKIQNDNCEYNTNEVKNQPETVETCNECISMERREAFQPPNLYCGDEERRFYANMPSNPHCCDQQFNEHNPHVSFFDFIILN